MHGLQADLNVYPRSKFKYKHISLDGISMSINEFYRQKNNLILNEEVKLLET